MAVTLEELKEKMVECLDETTILEILQISTEDLVERFEDKIDDRFDKLAGELFDEKETQETDTL